MRHLTSRAVSEITGVNIPTLRYYEQIGLLDPVQRANNGHRRYSENDLRRIEFIKRLRTTGMSIRAMLFYVELYRADRNTTPERLRILQDHRAVVQAQVERMLETLSFLDAKIERCKIEEAQLTAQTSVQVT